MADFLQFDPHLLSDRSLQEMIHKLSGSEAHQEKLRECQREQISRAMKNNGLTLKQIVRVLAGQTTRERRRSIAKEWAPLLGISESDFLKIAEFKKTSGSS